MKLKKFEQMILEREGFDDIDQPLDRRPFIDEEDEEEENWQDLDEVDEEEYEEEEEEEEYEEEEEEEEYEEEVTHSDVIEHLVSSLRKMIKLSFDNSYVFADDDSINVQFIFNKTEKFANIMKAMNMLKKLSTDTLIQYQSEFDLWRTTKGLPIITARFIYDEDVDSTQDVDPFE